MTDDIVTRLRHPDGYIDWEHSKTMDEAADEIERLRALITEWAAADDNTKWEEVTTAEWYAACDRIDAAEAALREEARRG